MVSKHKILIIIIAVFCLISGCTSNLVPRVIQTYQIQPSPVVSEEAEQQFLLTVAVNVDVNQGIWMALEPISGYDNMPQVKNSFIYAVFNSTDEEVVFDREDYDLAVFWYDLSLERWSEVHLNRYGSPKNVVLPPHFEKLDPTRTNEWYLSGDSLGNVEYTAIRLYIKGRGIVTGRVYGAYMDISLVH